MISIVLYLSSEFSNRFSHTNIPSLRDEEIVHFLIGNLLPDFSLEQHTNFKFQSDKQEMMSEINPYSTLYNVNSK